MVDMKGVVLSIPCAECSAINSGESGRTLKVRMTEHKWAVKKEDSTNGIAREDNWGRRRFLEALEIQQKRPRVNLKLGTGLILDPPDYLLTCTYIQYYITTTAPALCSRSSCLSSLSTTLFTLCRSTSFIYTRREIGWVSILHTCILVVVPHLRIYLEVPLVYQSTYTGLGI